MIRWNLQRGFVCIPKTGKEQRMVENMDVLDFYITEEDMQTLVGLHIVDSLHVMMSDCLSSFRRRDWMSTSSVIGQ